MSYKLGSIANLISGTSTAEKGKIITNRFKTQCVKENTQKSTESTNNANVNKNGEQLKNKTIEAQAKQQHFKGNGFETQNRKPFPGTKRGGKRNVEDAELSDSDNEKSPKRKKTIDGRKSQINIHPEVLEKTIFVGNWPLTSYNKGKVISIFEKYGKICNIRFRGIPVGDTRIPKKVAAITKNLHEKRTSLNVYIKFANKEDAVKALEANATVVDNHHIRVSISNEKPDTDQSKSIFVGNVAFVAEEDDLWKAFSICGKIKCVRIIRDSETNASKGFAYVNFESLDGVELALQMKDVKIHNRVVRIKRSQIQKNKVGKKRDAEGNKIRKNKQTEKHMNRKNSDGQNFSTKRFNKKNNFRGVVAEKKKKNKFNKNEHQKKKMIKKILPIKKTNKATEK